MKREHLNDAILNQSPQVIVSFGLPGFPEVRAGDNIGLQIVDRMNGLGGVQEKDVFVVASKVICKAEDRYVDLATVKPSEEAQRLYDRLKRKSPEIWQVIIDQSESYRIENDIVAVSKHKTGLVLTSAGVDSADGNRVLILPEEPDASARKILTTIGAETQKNIGVIISDSEGRVDRRGAGALSIGVAGINPLRVSESLGEDGKIRRAEETISDMLAAQASVIMGQRGNNIPVVCIRGFDFQFNPDANLRSILHA